MNFQEEGTKIYTLPEANELHPYWQHYFNENDQVIRENFWGNLLLLKNAKQDNDPYILQLEAMGYSFTEGDEYPAPYYQSIAWIFTQIQTLINQGILTAAEVIWPARVFELQNGLMVYKVIGIPPPDNCKEVELVPPHVFVSMLGQGFFPIGGSIREHTNQSLSEHDLAHFGGLIISPTFMKLVRQGFKKVTQKMHSNERIKQALNHYDSIYSLRLYYMIEVFTFIPDSKKSLLQELIELDINATLNMKLIIALLEEKSQCPDVLYHYLYKIYDNFYDLVEPVGGESRDILNRVRKFNRTNRLGIYFSELMNLDSKFDGSSLYSMYLNGCAALENKRSTHPDYYQALREIHAPFIGALIGTSQLTIEDWVGEAVEEQPNEQSKLYNYLCKSKIWDESHTIYWAYGCKEYQEILSLNSIKQNKALA